MAATEESLVRPGLVQYATGAGPCLDELRTQTLVRAERADMAERWPALAEAAERAGIVTSVSCPLFLPADGAVTNRRALHHRLSGALNVWSSRRGFAPVESTLIAMVASALPSIVLTAARWAAARKRADEPRTALATRDAIATAKGIVTVRQRLAVDDASRWQVEASQRTNHEVRELAS